MCYLNICIRYKNQSINSELISNIKHFLFSDILYYNFHKNFTGLQIYLLFYIIALWCVALIVKSVTTLRFIVVWGLCFFFLWRRRSYLITANIFLLECDICKYSLISDIPNFCLNNLFLILTFSIMLVVVFFSVSFGSLSLCRIT